MLPLLLAASAASPTGFRLDVHALTWPQLDLGYTQPAAGERLRALDWSDPALTLGDADIAWYDAAHQQLGLTTEAGERLRAAVRLSGKGPTALVDSHAFRATLDGTDLWHGIFLFPISAMGIQFPVAYVLDRDGALQVGLRPTHSAFTPWRSLPPAQRAVLELPAVRAHFRSKLVGVATLPADFPKAPPPRSADYAWAIDQVRRHRAGEIDFAALRAAVLARKLPSHPVGCAYLLVSPPPPPPGVAFVPSLMPADWAGTWGEVAMVYLLGGLDDVEYGLLHAAAHPGEAR